MNHRTLTPTQIKQAVAKLDKLSAEHIRLCAEHARLCAECSNQWTAARFRKVDAMNRRAGRAFAKLKKANAEQPMEVTAALLKREARHE